MSTARFTTEIGPDMTIRLPPGSPLHPGPAEVTVVQPAAVQGPAAADDEFPPGVPEIVKRLARLAREKHVPNSLPPDLAINHDHYLHGLPKGIDQP